MYYDYPTSTDSVPSNDLIDPDPGNNATFYHGDWPDSAGYTIGPPYYRTEAGAHENSDSPYGTLDQGGNVTEWNETDDGHHRVVRGGTCVDIDGNRMRAAIRMFYPVSESYADLGFRVAEVP